MTHSDHDHSVNPASSLWRALLITGGFFAFESLAGWAANSLALLSDAAHMLADVGALLLSLFVAWVGGFPSSPKMSFGYHRAEILGALASGVTIWVLTGFLLYGAFTRMLDPPEVKGTLVLGASIVGLGANLWSLRVLHGHSKGNLNVRAAYLHVVADSLGSVGAIVAGAVLSLTGWRLIDPIVTFLISGLLVHSAWSLIRESVEVLMESSPKWVSPDSIRRDLASLPGIEAVHDLHVWTVGHRRAALSVHLIARDARESLARANEALRGRHGIRHATIQIEHPDEFDASGCFDCGEG